MNSVEAIRNFQWPGLSILWSQIQAGATPEWFPGKALEHLVLRAFELDGAEVRWPYEAKIDGEIVEQIDGAIHVDGLSCLLECKDTADRVNIEPIAKMRNQLLRRPVGTVGIIVSRNGFTSPASTLAQFLAPQAILLWTGIELEHALRRENIRRMLQQKHRAYIEIGSADYDPRVEEER